MIPDHVEDNIASIALLRAGIANERSRHQRVVESVAHGLGRPLTIYLVLAVPLAWIAYNASAARVGWPQLDAAPYSWLQTVVALYAAFTTTLIVVAQSRQREESAQRGHLELQLNLLAEQKTTKIIALLEELRRDLPNVRNRTDPVADAMQQEVDPHDVHSAINR